ncbi:hypothetical protein P8452_74543 [Trifolium repens]|nr:hypothetical protein P8452_74543 [Trifolium repens]
MALEFVGSALLSASLQVAFDRLASAEVVDYFQGRKFNDKLLKKLNITLLSINAVIDDAEQKQIRNQHVKAWLDAVKDAVFEAEDLLDEIDIQVSQCKLEAESQSSPNKVWNFFNASTNSFGKEIESKMQEVLENLEYLSRKKDILGLKEASTSSGSGVGSGSLVSRKLPTTSLVAETVLYGRDVDKDIIFNWLRSRTDNEKQFSVVSIVGMGGMGKTLLAQHLYNDSKMEDEFDVKAWVCISVEFDVFKITRAILEGINGTIDDSRDLNMIGGYCMEASLLERIEPIISNIYLERMKIVGCPNMNIPIHSCYNFLVGLYIWSSCDSLTTFPLDLFPKLKELQFRACNNLEMISQEKTHNLKLLQISNCPKFVSFPRGMHLS